MNYFELFGFPVHLQVDPHLLRSKYLELSRRYHPDFHTRADSGVQQEALELSAQVNKGLRTFQDPDETIRYVLQLKGLMQEEEKYELPKEFLLEVMEINEALMDAEDPGQSVVLFGKLEALQADIEAPVKGTLRDYRGEWSDATLLPVKEYYFKKKYLDRLRRQLAGMG